LLIVYFNVFTFARFLQTTAEQFAETFMEKMQSSHKFNDAPNEWIFKASGSAEYLYGKHKMVDFEYVRRCLKKGQKVELTLMDKQSALEELHPSDQLVRCFYFE